ncbi:MAG: thioredoxin family protein [Clostridioides sp.]|jgi:predicted bacteriocin transport accessory protein|nr:thioredoxin family protein [Clostridioides sp.]
MRRIINEKNKFVILLLIIILLVICIIPFLLLGKIKEISALTLKNEKEYKLIYIGRDTCHQCVSFKPKLETIIKSNLINIDYYNTDKARKNNIENLNQFLDDTKIDSVPTVIVVNKGTVIKKFDGNTDVEELSKYIKDNIWSLRFRNK